MEREKIGERPRRKGRRKESGDTNSWFGYLTMVIMRVMRSMMVT
jgi:hypothetical protein